MVLVSVLYHTLLLIGDSILLGGYENGDEALDLSVVNANFTGYRPDEEFILDSTH